MIFEKAKAFYDEVEMSDKCNFSDDTNKALPVRM
jgi:hypothetical protein